MSKVTLSLCKQATSAALEMSLEPGLKLERNLSDATFATFDRKEGMEAVVGIIFKLRAGPFFRVIFFLTKKNNFFSRNFFLANF